VGAPYDYPECLMVFLAYLHVLLNIDYLFYNAIIKHDESHGSFFACLI
jgi:hypothetical protein